MESRIIEPKGLDDVHSPASEGSAHSIRLPEFPRGQGARSISVHGAKGRMSSGKPHSAARVRLPQEMQGSAVEPPETS